ncbi:MAG: hypothetical protein LBR37_00700, partial [Erysipelotrichaceae bacterium]|nr:hypothetical protein [Erysipelotrichaceae bacterium]
WEGENYFNEVEAYLLELGYEKGMVETEEYFYDITGTRVYGMVSEIWNEYYAENESEILPKETFVYYVTSYVSGRGEWNFYVAFDPLNGSETTSEAFDEIDPPTDYYLDSNTEEYYYYEFDDLTLIEECSIILENMGWMITYTSQNDGSEVIYTSVYLDILNGSAIIYTSYGDGNGKEIQMQFVDLFLFLDQIVETEGNFSVIVKEACLLSSGDTYLRQNEFAIDGALSWYLIQEIENSSGDDLYYEERYHDVSGQNTIAISRYSEDDEFSSSIEYLYANTFQTFWYCDIFESFRYADESLRDLFTLSGGVHTLNQPILEYYQSLSDDGEYYQAGTITNCEIIINGVDVIVNTGYYYEDITPEYEYYDETSLSMTFRLGDTTVVWPE